MIIIYRFSLFKLIQTMPIQFQLKINHFRKMKHNLPLKNTKKKKKKKTRKN